MTRGSSSNPLPFFHYKSPARLTQISSYTSEAGRQGRQGDIARQHLRICWRAAGCQLHPSRVGAALLFPAPFCPLRSSPPPAPPLPAIVDGDSRLRPFQRRNALIITRRHGERGRGGGRCCWFHFSVQGTTRGWTPNTPPPLLLPSSNVSGRCSGWIFV